MLDLQSTVSQLELQLKRKERELEENQEVKRHLYSKFQFINSVAY